MTSGTSGAPERGLTWMPESKRSAGRGTAAFAGPGEGATVRGRAMAAGGVRASTPATHSAQADTAIREEDPIFI